MLLIIIYAALREAVLLVKLVYVPAREVPGEYRLGFKYQFTFMMYSFR
jgi:hypothetical protein